MSDRYLIVGLGSIGRRHLRNLRTLRPDATIAALRSGPVPPGSHSDATDISFCCWQDAIEFAPKAAIVSGPASMHLDAAARLLEAGVPVLLEKPLAVDLSGAREVVARASQSNVFAVVGYNLRLRPSLVRTRELIENGAIGNVVAVRAEVGQYLPDWRPGQRYQDSVSARRVLGGGPLLELSHEFDYLYWMFGLPETALACGGRFGALDIDVEDVVEIVLQFHPSKRLIASVHLDFLQRAPDRRCRFIGSDGTLVWNAISDTIEIYRTSTGIWETITFPAESRDSTYSEELRLFLATVDGGRPTLPPLREGYDVLAIAVAAARSLEEGKAIGIDGYGHEH